MKQKVIGVFESKVNTSQLSNGQKLFFQDGEAGILSGRNVPQNMQGMKVGAAPFLMETGVYRWNSQEASFIFQ